VTTPQHPIGSGFGAQSTSSDVLSGIDLSGRLAIITGGYSGLGLATTRALAGAGARVVVPARRPDAATEAVGDLPNVEVAELDLSQLDSVRKFAEGFLATGQDIHILLANAGIMACPLTRVGPGWEAQFAVNHLGHYTLVNLLWPALTRAGARVVTVSSGAHAMGVRWDDLHFERDYDKWKAYGQSKAANVLFTVQLDAFGRDAGVRAFSVDPGSILTPLQRHLAKAEMVAAGWIDEDGNPADPTFKAREQGAATQVWAATSPQLAGLGGVHCQDCDITRPASEGGGVAEHAIDPAHAERMWTTSAELTGIDEISSGT
jgi:NAD(P)-dependent dehydrogenase (short-subunit alcohol dehydrogenase family)